MEPPILSVRFAQHGRTWASEYLSASAGMGKPSVRPTLPLVVKCFTGPAGHRSAVRAGRATVCTAWKRRMGRRIPFGAFAPRPGEMVQLLLLNEGVGCAASAGSDSCRTGRQRAFGHCECAPHGCTLYMACLVTEPLLYVSTTVPDHLKLPVTEI